MFGSVKKLRAAYIIIVLLMLFGVIGGRAVGLEHNMMMHPDEFVFYGSAEVLMSDILRGDEYEPIKPYPEGAFVFRLPFQMLAQALPLSDDYEVSVAAWGRVASVFYYSIGCLAGLWLTVCALDGGAAGAVIYALTVCFSLFQIELSRYGTFDPISFMLLMLLIVTVVLYLRKDSGAYLALAGLLTGVLTAGKYSLIYFSLLPLAGLVLARGTRAKKTGRLCVFGLCALAGLLLFSPSAFKSPGFFVRAALDGLFGYIGGGNIEGFSTVPDRLLSLAAYRLLYADIPLSSVFAVLCVISLRKSGVKSAERSFITVVVPAAALIFLGYNVLVKTFFMRTLFPYYALALLYASAGLGRMCTGRRMKTVAAVLCLIMSVRGGLLIYMMSESASERYTGDGLMALAEDAEVTKKTRLGSYAFLSELERRCDSADFARIGTGELLDGVSYTMQPGELLVTSSLEHGMAKKCFFRPDNENIKNITENWERFKRENSQYRVGTLYPDYIYWLFGFWVHGSTATNYEFPTNWLYYMPVA